MIFDFSAQNYSPNLEFNFSPIHYNMGSGERVFVELDMDYHHLGGPPYNLSLCVKQYDWEFNNQCRIYIATGQTLFVELETDKNYQFNFEICDDTQPDPDGFLQAIELGYEVCPNREELRVQPIYTGENVYPILTFSPLYIYAPTHPDGELNLTECTPNADFNLFTCRGLIEVSGKNLNHDINLCNIPNPPLYADPHRIEFQQYINWRCDVFSASSYSGESGRAELQKDVILPMDSMDAGESAYTRYLSLEVKFYNAKGYSGEDCELLSFEDNPFDRLEPVAEVGENADLLSFQTTDHLYLDTTYTSEYSDADLTDNPPDRLEPVAEVGENADVLTFENYPQFDGDSYTGEESQPYELDDHPSIEMQADAESGEYSDTVKLEISARFKPYVYTGEYGDSDLYDSPSSEIEGDAESGEYADVLDMATTFALYPNAYPGEYGDVVEINMASVLRARGSSGEYADCDFYANLPFEMLPNVYPGENADVLSMATTLALFPRMYSGQSTNIAIETYPSPSLILDSMFGGESIPGFILEERTQYARGYTGESGDLLDLATELRLKPFGESGSSAETVALNLSAGMYGRGYGGEETEIPELYIHPGQEFEFIVESGESGWMGGDGIKFYPKLLPELIISSQTMYDGFGGAGGLNFCNTDCCCCTPDPLDLVIDARPSDREPWGKCGPEEDTAMYVSLQGNVRFKGIGSSGENLVAYIPKPYMAFNDMGDDEYILYKERVFPQARLVDYLDPNASTGSGKPDEFMFLVLDGEPVYDPDATDDFDTALSMPAQTATAELIVQPIVVFDVGEELEVDLSTLDARWKYPFRHFVTGESVDCNFEANEWIRFCPGYLIPEGNNVIFDFASILKTDCMGWFSQTGESMPIVFLKTTVGLPPRMYSGERSWASLTTFPPWLLHARTGENATWYGEATLNPRVHTGEGTYLKMERRAYEGGSGENTKAYLAISLPGVDWITKKGCIENVYNPLTPDGDIDLDYENFGICIENLPFLGKLKAECSDEYTHHPIMHLEVIGYGTENKVDLTPTKHFKPLLIDSGQIVDWQEWNVNVGESTSIEFTVFLPAEFELLAEDGSSSYAKLKDFGAQHFVLDFETGEESNTLELS